MIDKILGPKDDYFDAIILLLTDFRVIDKDSVERLLPPGSFTPLIHGDRGEMTLMSPGYVFNILCANRPYAPFGRGPEYLADLCRDLRYKERVTQHRAFISLNANSETPAPMRELTRAFITRVAENLVDDTLLVMMDAESGNMVIPTPESTRLLGSGDRNRAFDVRSGDPVLSVRKEQIATEVAEARARFSEFREAFARQSPGSAFMVKMEFKDAWMDYIEHMWVYPTSVDDNSITGKLVSEPHRLKSVRKGQRVTVPVSKLTDWVYTEVGIQVGLFTEKKVLGE